MSWNNCFSKYFSISNGVKQGGVLSPTLFSIYIDKLLLKLKESGYGCHLNEIYMGALAYADDIYISLFAHTSYKVVHRKCNCIQTEYIKR